MTIPRTGFAHTEGSITNGWPVSGAFGPVRVRDEVDEPSEIGLNRRIRDRISEPGSFRRIPESDPFADLAQRLLQDHLTEVPDEEEKAWLHLAARDAASIAWSMPYSLLVLPELLSEMIEGARRRYRQQERIRAQSREFLLAKQ